MTKFFVNRDRKLVTVKEKAGDADFVYMVSKECNIREAKAGVVCAMTLPRAAESLVDDSYEFATDEQIAAYKSAQDAEAERIVTADLKRSGGIQSLTDALSTVRGNRASKANRG